MSESTEETNEVEESVDSSTDEVNTLELSDEEFGKLTFPDDPVKEEEVSEEKPTEADPNEETEDEQETEATEQGKQDEETTTTDDGVEEKPEPGKEEPAGIDYQAEYEKLMAPFKANGKEVTTTSVDDVIALKQMGANYNKKMTGLKPVLKLVKMLENNGLLDESKLNYLIDLDKKNPQAIEKLVKDSGVDPLEIDTEKETEYTPNTYNVNDKQVELDQVLDDIKDTPGFDKTMDIIGNKWDASSKDVLVNEPSIIKVINEHMSNGIYDKITSVVESERMLGRLTGISDLEAYKQVGEAIKARGGFDPSSAKEQPTATTKPKADSPKLKNKRKAASSTKAASKIAPKEVFSPLSLSDEEFEKATAGTFL